MRDRNNITYFQKRITINQDGKKISTPPITQDKNTKSIDQTKVSQLSINPPKEATTNTVASRVQQAFSSSVNMFRQIFSPTENKQLQGKGYMLSNSQQKNITDKPILMKNDNINKKQEYKVIKETISCADSMPNDIITFNTKLRIYFKNPNTIRGEEMCSIIEAKDGIRYKHVVKHLRNKFTKMFSESSYRMRSLKPDNTERKETCDDLGVCIDEFNNINIKNFKITTVGQHTILRLEYIN